MQHSTRVGWHPFKAWFVVEFRAANNPGRIPFSCKEPRKNAAVNARGAFYKLDAMSFRFIGFTCHLLRGSAGDVCADSRTEVPAGDGRESGPRQVRSRRSRRSISLA